MNAAIFGVLIATSLAPQAPRVAFLPVDDDAVLDRAIRSELDAHLGDRSVPVELVRLRVTAGTQDVRCDRATTDCLVELGILCDADVVLVVEKNSAGSAEVTVRVIDVVAGEQTSSVHMRVSAVPTRAEVRDLLAGIPGAAPEPVVAPPVVDPPVLAPPVIAQKERLPRSPAPIIALSTGVVVALGGAAALVIGLTPRISYEVDAASLRSIEQRETDTQALKRDQPAIQAARADLAADAAAWRDWGALTTIGGGAALAIAAVVIGVATAFIVDDEPSP